jgi:hypothetical protein
MKLISTVTLIVLCFFIRDQASAQVAARLPEQVAQALVEAFNARDMDEILKAYATDSSAYGLPGGEVILKGHDEIRGKFASLLSPTTKLQVEVVDRIIDGKFVIDKERIFGTSDGQAVEFYSTVIYEITGGLIRKEWYLEQ